MYKVNYSTLGLLCYIMFPNSPSKKRDKSAKNQNYLEGKLI
jgi:hypothetical protein